MNDATRQHNIKLADELTDGHYQSYGLLYKVDGPKAVIAWGIREGAITGSCVMTVETDQLKKTIIESEIERRMIPISIEEYNKTLDDILKTIH